MNCNRKKSTTGSLGQGLAEVIIIVLLVSVAALVSVRLFGHSVRCNYSGASSQLGASAGDKECPAPTEEVKNEESETPQPHGTPAPPPTLAASIITPAPTQTSAPTAQPNLPCGQAPEGGGCLPAGACCAVLSNRDSCKSLCCPSHIASNCYKDVEANSPTIRGKCFCAGG